jgi:hypothetical protein
MSKVIQKVKLIEFTETKIGRGQRRIGRISPDLSSKNLFCLLKIFKCCLDLSAQMHFIRVHSRPILL